MKYAWLVIGVFLARFLTDAIAFPAGDGDLSWQRWLGGRILATHAIPRALGGETFSAVGSPWTPQEWAFSIGVSFAKSGEASWFVFAAIVALGAGLALALVARTSVLLGASPVWTAFGTALAGVSILQSFGVRAQVAAWPLVAALMLLLRLRDRRVWWIVALTAVWSNLHASVLLAPCAVGLVAAGTFFDEGRRVTPEVRRLALVAAASLLATCANPFGIGLPLYATHLFGNQALRGMINEWQPTRLTDTSFSYGALGLLLAGIVTGLGAGIERPAGASRMRDVFVVWAFAFLLLAAGRNVSIFGIVAGPLVAAAVSTRVRAAFPGKLGAPEPVSYERFVRDVVLPGVSIVLIVVIASVMLARVREKPADLGLERAGAALARTADRDLFCEDFAWCSSFLASGERDYLDGRADPFPDAVWADYGKILRLSPGWREIFAARGIDAVIAHRYGVIDQALALAGGWRSIYADDLYDVLVREPKRAAGPTASPGTARRTASRPARP